MANSLVGQAVARRAAMLGGRPTAATAATPAPNADLSQLRASVSDILGFQGKAAAANAAATAADFQGAGATAQETAYQNAAQIAKQNAGLEEMSGRIQQLQAQRTVASTMGAQTAEAASSGLQTAGSVLSGLRSSYQQGRLTDQLISTQTGINVGGFLEQQSAATGEANAAGVAAAGAAALASAERAAAGSATTSAAAETSALMGYLSATGQIGGTPNSPNLGSMTPGANVALSPLSGTNGVPNLGTPNWTQNPDGTWTYGQGAGAMGAGGAGLNQMTMAEHARLSDTPQSRAELLQGILPSAAGVPGGFLQPSPNF